MEEANKFFNNLNSNNNDINIAKLGIIEKVYENGLFADIQPLPSESNPLILQVPLVFPQTSESFIYMPYKVGDTVLLVFIDVNIDNLLLGSDNLASSIEHSDSDCICVGRISTQNKPSISNINDTIIKHGKSKITMSENGDIEIDGSHIKLKADRIDLN